MKQHQDHLTIHKLRTNTSLTASGLVELERMLISNGVDDQAALEKASAEHVEDCSQCCVRSSPLP